MNVNVFDTHVRTRDGRYLHFDALIEGNNIAGHHPTRPQCQFRPCTAGRILLRVLRARLRNAGVGCLPKKIPNKKG